MTRIKVFTTDGSIDKSYPTRESSFIVGSPRVGPILREGNVALDCEIEPLLRKDNLEITEDDRQRIVERVRATPHRRVLITHGTDTMIDTPRALASISGRVIVLTGAMQPAAFRRCRRCAGFARRRLRGDERPHLRSTQHQEGRRAGQVRGGCMTHCSSGRRPEAAASHSSLRLSVRGDVR